MVGLGKYIGYRAQARLGVRSWGEELFENLFWAGRKARQVSARIEDSRREPLKNTKTTGKNGNPGLPWVVENLCDQPMSAEWEAALDRRTEIMKVMGYEAGSIRPHSRYEAQMTR